MTYSATLDYRGRRTFGAAVAICLKNYVTFSGRAPRSEYWFFVLFIFLAYVVCIILDSIIFNGKEVFVILMYLASLLPSLAVLVRRLHDTDRSGWWVFFNLVPVIGPIMILIWTCTRGSEGPNRFGIDPLGGNG